MLSGIEIPFFSNLLEDISTAPTCEVSVCAGGPDAGSAMRLLQSYAIETTGGVGFQLGNPTSAAFLERLTQSLRRGEFFQYYESSKGFFSKELEDRCDSTKATPESRFRDLSKLAVLAGPDLTQDLLTLPISRGGLLRTFPLETDLNRALPPIRPPAQLPDGKITFGKDLDRGMSVQMDLTLLNKHAFVAGVTGSGKTMTVFNILRQLSAQEIPFFVIEPIKAEYRGLASLSEWLKKNLRVYTPGQERLSPIRLNPFEFGSRITLGEHVANLMSAFQGALPLFEPLPSILKEALWNLYEDSGWDEDDCGSVDRPVPQMSDVLDAVYGVLDRLNYGAEVDSNFRAAFRARFVRLTRGNVGRFFNSSRTMPRLDDLFSHPTVLELGAFSQEQINLATMFFLVLVREHMKSDSSRAPLKLVMVLEEAHNLVPAAEGRSQQDGELDLRGEASRYITNLLAEMRALGLSIIVVDQAPSGVSDFVVKNTNLKIAHRTVSKEDRQTLGQAMLMNEAEEEMLGRLLPGQAYLYTEQYHRPVRIGNYLVGDPANDVRYDLDSNAFTNWLDSRTWFLKSLGTRLSDLLGIATRYSAQTSSWSESLTEIGPLELLEPELKSDMRRSLFEKLKHQERTLERFKSELSNIQAVAERARSNGKCAGWLGSEEDQSLMNLILDVTSCVCILEDTYNQMRASFEAGEYNE